MFTKIVYSESIVYNTVVIIHKTLNNYSLYRNNKEKGYIFFFFEICTLFIFLRRKKNRRNAGGGVRIWRAAWLSVSSLDLRGSSGRAGSSPVPVVPVIPPGVVSGRLAHRGAPPCRPVSMGDVSASGALRVPFRRRCAQLVHAYNNRCVRVFAFWGYILYIIIPPSFSTNDSGILCAVLTNRKNMRKRD